MNDDLSEAQFESGRKRKLTEHHAGNILACSAGVFWAGESCLFICSYCCNRHLCYDRRRLGRVKIVTLRVGAKAKEGKRGGGGEKTPLLLTRPIFSSLFEFQHA